MVGRSPTGGMTGRYSGTVPSMLDDGRQKPPSANRLWFKMDGLPLLMALVAIIIGAVVALVRSVF